MGIREVRADAVMIVHADCRLRRGVMGRVVESLNTDPQVVGGALSMAFQPADRKKRIIAALNSLRTRLSGIAFGDQCQFFRTEALPAIGGFPDQMLMEDVELSLRIENHGSPDFPSEGGASFRAPLGKSTPYTGRGNGIETVLPLSDPAPLGCRG